jgi:predicted negative regulator of RcsB-dependent stress response
MILGVAGYVAWKVWKKKAEAANTATATAVATKAAPKVEVRVPTKV